MKAQTRAHDDFYLLKFSVLIPMSLVSATVVYNICVLSPLYKAVSVYFTVPICIYKLAYGPIGIHVPISPNTYNL